MRHCISEIANSERRSLSTFGMKLGATLWMTCGVLLLFIGSVYAQVPLTPIKSEHPDEVVVLIHGLMRSTWSMLPLKYSLEEHGYTVYNYEYHSARYTISEHGIHLNQYIDNFLVKNPHLKIHFITHSLGGIIVRESLSKRSKKQLKNIGYLIMLAPPNQGSELATLSTKLAPMISHSIKPLAELSSEKHSYVHQIPVPAIKIGIIAGKYDAKVPPASAQLAGLPLPVVVNTNHMFIMSNSRTKKLVLNFLEKGRFE